MSDFECSPELLQNAATNASTIGNALSTNPVHQLAAGDVGHAGLNAAIRTFHTAWSNELRLRASATTNASQLLTNTAADVARLDALIANASSRLGDGL